MRKYQTKSKIFGYKIGLNNDNVYIAIPKKYFKDGGVQVTCEGETRVFSEEDKKGEATQKDKFNGGMNYTLFYFLWKSYESKEG